MSSLVGVKVGDEVIFEFNGGGVRILKVERVTKTQVITDTGMKFRKKDGYRVGMGSWNIDTIRLGNTDDLEAARKHIRRQYLKGRIDRDLRVNSAKITLEQYEKIAAIIVNETPGYI